MRPLYFLVPGTLPPFGGGGLWAELKFCQLVQQLAPAELVTYRQRESGYRFLPEVLNRELPGESVFVVSWGFDVPRLIRQLRGRPVVYHAHSAGYGFSLPADIPIVAVSRNTMGYWGQHSPNSPIYYLPNQIGEEFYNRNQPRDIDVLVQGRKSSEYLLQQLVPALRSCCRVEVLDGYVEDLAGLFNRSRIYLYDSAEYWATSGVTEGFGLPPMEALACGCQVFSSVNSALADYLDPGFNCHKIAAYSTAYDVQRILAILADGYAPALSASYFDPYRAPALTQRLQTILREIETFFDCKPSMRADIPNLTYWRKAQLKVEQLITKVQRKLKR